MKRPLFLLLSLLLLLTDCKKNDPSPEEQLPAATQTGENTFGCLLNGQTWQPDGPILLSYWPAYEVTYDSLKSGGELHLNVFRFIAATHSDQAFNISSFNIQKPGVYPVDGVTCGVYYSNPLASGDCGEFFNAQYFNANGATHVQGQLIITRLDKKRRIVSGLFSFILSKQNCDSIKVTKGRFDRYYR